jgi:hypothetical protein
MTKLRHFFKDFWTKTISFKKVENPVWKNYSKTNGFIEKYYYIRFLLQRGKHHPQILLSMAAEYALVLFIFNAFGLNITTKTVVLLTIILMFVLIFWGYIDVFFDVARKSTSFTNRFNPEWQELFKDVKDIKKKLGEKKRVTK